MQVFEGAGDCTSPGNALNHHVEHVRVPDLSVGTYSIPAGGTDDQLPHTEDEIYVPAHEEHRFVEDLALIVVFGPAYRSRAEP